MLETFRFITEKLHNVNGIVLNFNPTRQQFWKEFGKENILFGNDFIEDEINGVSFKISPKSFLHQNRRVLKTIKTLELQICKQMRLN